MFCPLASFRHFSALSPLSSAGSVTGVSSSGARVIAAMITHGEKTGRKSCALVLFIEGPVPTFQAHS